MSPLQSVRAYQVLFDVALGYLTEASVHLDPAIVRSWFGCAARLLHRRISTRIAAGMIGHAATHPADGEPAELTTRRELARDLHDRVGSSLSLALAALDLHESDLKEGRASPKRLADVRAALKDTVRFTRDIVRGLRTPHGQATRHRPDVILLDVEMPGAGVLRTICMLVQAVPESKIIVLTMHDDTGLPDSLIAAGATAYLHKGVDSGVLFAAIRSSLQGCVITALPTARESPTESGPLTRRQQQLMRHVAAGLSNRQIGVQLGITVGTVKRHLRDIFDRLCALAGRGRQQVPRDTSDRLSTRSLPPSLGFRTRRGRFARSR